MLLTPEGYSKPVVVDYSMISIPLTIYFAV